MNIVYDERKLTMVTYALEALARKRTFTDTLTNQALFIAPNYLTQSLKPKSILPKITMGYATLLIINGDYLDTIRTCLNKKEEPKPVETAEVPYLTTIVPSVTSVDHPLNLGLSKLGTPLLKIPSLLKNSINWKKLNEIPSVVCDATLPECEIFINSKKITPSFTNVPVAKIEEVVSNFTILEGAKLKLIGKPNSKLDFSSAASENDFDEYNQDILEIDMIEEELGKTSKLTKFIQSNKGTYKRKRRKLATAGFVDGLVFAGLVGFSLGLILMSILAFIRM